MHVSEELQTSSSGDREAGTDPMNSDIVGGGGQ